TLFRSEDNKQEVLANLRKSLKSIDSLSDEWSKLETKLKEQFYELENVNKDFGNDKTTQSVNQLRSQLDEVIKSQDVKLGKSLSEEMEALFIRLKIGRAH